jgi:hypothetical protein
MSQATVDPMTRLPKWAQRRIEVLEMRVKELRARLAVGPEASNTFADPHTDSPRPLGEGTIVRFVLSRHPDGTPLDYVDATIEGGSEKRVYIRASYGYAFYPNSSNAGYVKLVRP